MGWADLSSLTTSCCLLRVLLFLEVTVKKNHKLNTFREQERAQNNLCMHLCSQILLLAMTESACSVRLNKFIEDGESAFLLWMQTF